MLVVVGVVGQLCLQQPGVDGRVRHDGGDLIVEQWREQSARGSDPSVVCLQDRADQCLLAAGSEQGVDAFEHLGRPSVLTDKQRHPDLDGGRVGDQRAREFPALQAKPVPAQRGLDLVVVGTERSSRVFLPELVQDTIREFTPCG
jgi:hypothetical protein